MAADVLAVHYLGAGLGFCCCCFVLFVVVVVLLFCVCVGGGGGEEQPSWLPRGSAQFMVVSACPTCTASHLIIMEQFHCWSDIPHPTSSHLIIMEQFHCWSDIPHPTSSFHISLSTTAFFYTPEIPVSDSTPPSSEGSMV